MSLLDEVEIGDVLPWSRIAEVHKIRNGIYQRSGRLISLLTDFGRINPCGFESRVMTSMHAELGTADIGKVKAALIDALGHSLARG